MRFKGLYNKESSYWTKIRKCKKTGRAVLKGKVLLAVAIGLMEEDILKEDEGKKRG